MAMIFTKSCKNVQTHMAQFYRLLPYRIHMHARSSAVAEKSRV